MAEPIRPQKNITNGGVKFNVNETDAHGKTKDGKFYINFKDGSKIVYPKQTADNCASIFTDEYGDTNYNSISGLEYTANEEGDTAYVEGDTAGKEEYIGYYCYFNNCDNAKIKTSNMRDSIDINQCSNVEIEAGGGDDAISLYSADNAIVRTGEGEDTIYAKDCNNVDVHLDTEDSLEVAKTKSGHVTFGLNDAEYFREDIATVEGEGVHNTDDTPEEAFVEGETIIVNESRSQSFRPLI